MIMFPIQMLFNHCVYNTVTKFRIIKEALSWLIRQQGIQRCLLATTQFLFNVRVIGLLLCMYRHLILSFCLTSVCVWLGKFKLIFSDILESIYYRYHHQAIKTCLFSNQSKHSQKFQCRIFLFNRFQVFIDSNKHW